MFKHSPNGNGKAWFMAPMEYHPNGKDIMVLSWVIGPIGKVWFYEDCFLKC